MVDVDPFAALEDLGTFRVFAPQGLTDSGRIHRWQTRTVSKLAEAAVGFRDDLNAALYEVIKTSYTEGEGTFAETTKARLGSTSRDQIEVNVYTGAAHAIYLTALGGGQPGTEHDEFAGRQPVMTFLWKSPPAGVGPPGVYQFKHVLWRPHNIEPGADPVAQVITYYADRWQSVMLETHGNAMTEFVSGSDGQMVEVS